MTADVEVFGADAATPTDVVFADGTVVEGFDQPLTTDEAQELTEHIRSTADVLYVLLARAHAGKAWSALGYSTFADYVREEFNMSRSRAYQILDQHRVIEALEAAVPDGTQLRITEAQARDLKSVINEVVPAVQSATAGMTAEDAQQMTEEIVEDYRQQAREERDQARDGQEGFGEEPGYQGGGGMPGTFGGGNGGGGGGYFPDEDEDFDEDSGDIDDAPPVDASAIRRRVQAAYDFYTATGALSAMPDVHEVIETINPDRVPQVRNQLPGALAWLKEFAEAWEEAHPTPSVDE